MKIGYPDDVAVPVRYAVLRFTYEDELRMQRPYACMDVCMYVLYLLHVCMCMQA